MPSPKKTTIILITIGLVLISWLCYELFFSRTNRSVVALVSGIELDDTYNIQTIYDDWADPTSLHGEGTALFKVKLTEQQCSNLIQEATKLNYQPCPIVYEAMGLPPEVSGITNGMYRMKLGVPDNRDVDMCVIDTSNKIMYVYICIM